jgi:hypothetical protein
MKPVPLLPVSLLVVLAAGCADRLSLEGAPCPCAEGYSCNVQTQVCMAPLGDAAAAAPSPDAGEPPSGPASQPDADGNPEPPTNDPKTPPLSCREQGILNLEDFERIFIAPRCGMSACHQSVFPPRNLNTTSMIRTALVGQKALTLCKDDYYIHPTDITKSFMLAKVTAVGDTVTCPSGGTPGSGGSRMPNVPGMPTISGKRLTAAEIECLTWWVGSVMKEASRNRPG